MINWHDPISAWTGAGTIASVIGLAISIALIFITRGAKRAAEDAERAVQTYGRKRGLVEELESVHHKADQLGALIQHEQWFAVQMRIQEIHGTCIEALNRWPDGLTEEKRDDLLAASELARSISSRISAQDFNNSERGKLTTTQLKLSGRIVSALAEARMTEERTHLTP